MNYHCKLARPALLAALVLVTLTSVVVPGVAADGKAPPTTISLSSLKGLWALSLVGFTGCGQESIYATFNLNASGMGTATVQFHGQCGDSTTGGLPFVIQSLNANGSGTANLSCGPGCGWNLIIQVAKEGQVFSAVDVDPANPGNFLSGTAVHFQ